MRAAARLRSLVVERDAEVEDGALAHEPRRGHELVRRDQVERAPLVLGAPPAPVAQPLAQLPEVLHDALPLLARRRSQARSDVLGQRGEVIEHLGPVHPGVVHAQRHPVRPLATDLGQRRQDVDDLLGRAGHDAGRGLARRRSRRARRSSRRRLALRPRRTTTSTTVRSSCRGAGRRVRPPGTARRRGRARATSRWRPAAAHDRPGRPPRRGPRAAGGCRRARRPARCSRRRSPPPVRWPRRPSRPTRSTAVPAAPAAR